MPPKTSRYIPIAQRGGTRSFGGSNDLLEATKRGISWVETRGAADPYSKKGVVVSKGQYAGDRALGKYQVMGKNIRPWTKQYLGREISPEEYLASPQIQEELASARMGELLKQYGNPEDVASVWFTGRPLAKAGGAPTDDTGTSNSEYQKIFREGMGRTLAATPTGSRYIPMAQRGLYTNVGLT